jgi:UDP-N-acetylmuramoylalanine--D-glutamate ligase
MDIKGLQFAIFGMGESGVDTAEFLMRRGAKVRAVDRKPLASLKPEHAKRLEEAHVPLFAQDEAALANVDFALLSPGVTPSQPLFDEARRRGIRVTGELEFCSRFLRGPILGITGSNGKTTTTSLCGHLLKESGIPVQVGGNIGTPLAALLESSRDDQWNVLELSSFMLELADTLHVHVASILNITPDHLDRHGSLENYANAKRRMLRNQTPSDAAVLNAENPLSRESAAFTKGAVH